MLNEVIDDCQSAFILGRSISDNMIVGHELLHFLRSRKNGQQGFVALKLDMSKAYDRVEWSFIYAVMEKLGFPTIWIDLVKDCISTASFSILINGVAKGHFSATRGLR